MRRTRFVHALALAILMAGIGAALASWATTQKFEARAQNRQATENRQQIAARLSQVQTEEITLRPRLAHFNALQRRGVIGPEHRLEWTERLSQIRRAHTQRLDYEIAPQTLLEKPGVGLNVHASSMIIKAHLLHEGDLLRLIDALHAIDSAIVLPRRCTIERQEPGVPNPELFASCEFDWITLTLDQAQP